MQNKLNKNQRYYLMVAKPNSVLNTETTTTVYIGKCNESTNLFNNFKYVINGQNKSCGAKVINFEEFEMKMCLIQNKEEIFEYLYKFEKYNEIKAIFMNKQPSLRFEYLDFKMSKIKTETIEEMNICKRTIEYFNSKIINKYLKGE